MELAAGTVLLHAHSDTVDETTLLVAVHDGELRLPGTDMPVRILLTLVSPHDSSPERHLGALSRLAQIFRDQEIAARISGADTAEAIVHLLKTAEQAPGAGAPVSA